MLYLFLSIFSSIAILIIFKIIGKYNIKVIQPIIINYFVASALGFFSSGLSPKEVLQISPDWVLPGLLIGSLYVFTFFLIGYSTEKSRNGIDNHSIQVELCFSNVFLNTNRLKGYLFKHKTHTIANGNTCRISISI